MSNQEDFQVKVEKIIENYMQKHRVSRRNSISHSENSTSEIELIEKQMTKTTLLTDVISKFQTIIDCTNSKNNCELEQRFVKIEQEIVQLRSLIIQQPQEYIQPQLVYNRSENNSLLEIMSDTFLTDETQISSLKKKIKEIQESFTRKTQQLENMITLVIDQQMQLKQQVLQQSNQHDFNQYSDKLLEQIQTKIQLINQQHLDDKFQQFKKVVDEMRQQNREKQALLMTLLEECKHDCEKIDKKVNDHFSSKKSSWIPFK